MFVPCAKANIAKVGASPAAISSVTEGLGVVLPRQLAVIGSV